MAAEPVPQCWTHCRQQWKDCTGVQQGQPGYLSAADVRDGIILVSACIYVLGLIFRLLPRVMDSPGIIYSRFQ